MATTHRPPLQANAQQSFQQRRKFRGQRHFLSKHQRQWRRQRHFVALPIQPCPQRSFFSKSGATAPAQTTLPLSSGHSNTQTTSTTACTPSYLISNLEAVKVSFFYEIKILLRCNSYSEIAHWSIFLRSELLNVYFAASPGICYSLHSTA